MREGLAKAIEEEELRTVLTQHAYSYKKEDTSVADTLISLSKLNKNSDNPLDPSELEDIVKKAFEKKKSNKKEEDNTIYTSYYEDNNTILEQLSCSPHSPHSPRDFVMRSPIFIKYSKLDDTWEEVSEFENENLVYKPIDNDLSKKEGVKLSSGVIDYESTAEIVKDIKEFLHEGAEIPKMYEDLLPYLILFYWVYEKFPFIPYVQFVGGTGTGKTTAMEAFGALCYKSIDTTGSMTISSIFRIATMWKGTMLIDEFESMGENSRDMISFLKSGVSDRLVIRTEGDIKHFDLKAYVVKAPKIFTSEKPIEDAGLQSRTIVIEMEKNTRPIPLYKLSKFYEKADMIRNKLLLWRMRTINKINLTDIEYGFKELQIFDRRVQQIITPIYYFSDAQARNEILSIAKAQEDETLRQRRESDEGKIFEYIVENYKNTIPTTLSGLAVFMNKGRKVPIQERGVSEVIRKILGLDIKRVGTGEDKESIVIVDTVEAVKHIEQKSSYFGMSIVNKENNE